jgi:hypothetical protein
LGGSALRRRCIQGFSERLCRYLVHKVLSNVSRVHLTQVNPTETRSLGGTRLFRRGVSRGIGGRCHKPAASSDMGIVGRWCRSKHTYSTLPRRCNAQCRFARAARHLMEPRRRHACPFWRGVAGKERFVLDVGDRGKRHRCGWEHSGIWVWAPLGGWGGRYVNKLGEEPWRWRWMRDSYTY